MQLQFLTKKKGAKQAGVFRVSKMTGCDGSVQNIRGIEEKEGIGRRRESEQ